VDCRERALPARRTCLERLAAGDGVPAQNALYSLGLLEREHGRTAAALAAWRTYERRFAAGLLAPEVSVAILRSLLDDRRYAEALARAEAFEQRFAGETRRPEVALIRAKLLCLRFGRLDDAQAAFEAALAATTPSVRQDALYARAHCLQLLAGEAAARQAWRAYREAFPDAPRGRSVESQVAP
jgi:tetratricopeptide (TPR) repeat protein